MNTKARKGTFPGRWLSGSLLMAGLAAQMAGLPARAEPTLAPGTIITVAGNGEPGFSGDGGPATDARLNNPRGIAIDAAGRLSITEWANNRVRRVAPDGTITTVAGGGTLSGAKVNGSLATRIKLNAPSDVAVDAAGSLYITEAYGNRVLHVGVDGTVAVVAGGGMKVLLQPGDSGPATDVRLNNPTSVAIDAAGNLCIADYNNGRVRRVDPGGTLTNLAGATEESRLVEPLQMTVDAAGNVLVTQFGKNRVLEIRPDGVMVPVAGQTPGGFDGDGGPALEAKLNQVYGGVAVDTAGNVFIADDGNHRIRKIDAVTGIITTIAGDGSAGFSGDGGPATEAQLNLPDDIAIDAQGNVVFSDWDGHRVRKVIGVAARGLLNGRPFPAGAAPISGDLDGSGAVDIKDATLSLQIAEGALTVTEFHRSVGDLNGDGMLNLKDTVLLLRRAVGLSP